MNPFGLAARRLCWVSSGALLIAGCDLAVPARTQPPSAASSRAAAAEIVTPERRTIRLIVEQPGQVEADEATPLHAKLSGYVESVAVDIGDHVKAGQVLARLAVPELQAEAAQKAAAIIQADAVVRQAKAAINFAKPRARVLCCSVSLA